MPLPFRPATILPGADDLRAFEAEFGFGLPDDYRAFLLEYVLFPGDAYLEKQDAGEPITPADYHCLTGSFSALLDGLAWQRS